MSKKSGNGFSGFIIICAIVFILYVIGVSGQCNRSGCTNKKESGSNYCYIHSYRSSAYNTSSYKSTGSYSSSANGSTNYNKSTSYSSTCSLSGCNDSKASGSNYCRMHTCQEQGCRSLSDGNGTIYCDIHAAAYVRRQGYNKCLKSRCYRKQSSNGLYCSEHTCKTKDCRNSKADGSSYCSTHSKSKTNYSSTDKANSSSSKSSSSSSKKYSDPYNVQDYVDPEDFYYDYYDDFFDFEDAEDYWNDNHK